VTRFAELCYAVIDGKITREQLDRELVEATFVPDQWKEATLLLVEPAMPEELKGYYSKSPELRAKINEPAYLKKFSGYSHQCYEIRLHNKNRLTWLIDLKTMVPAEDALRQKMIDEAISKFSKALGISEVNRKNGFGPQPGRNFMESSQGRQG
jgi:hypothetical protein